EDQGKSDVHSHGRQSSSPLAKFRQSSNRADLRGSNLSLDKRPRRIVMQPMKLPNVHLAMVPEQKVTRYLLDPAHPAGGSKAAFFLRFGFLASNWRRLADALLAHARNNEVVATE